MPIVPVPFVSGDAITEALMLTELNRVRGWIDTGMVAGDITDQTLDFTRVYRPETYGFPKQNSEGTTQEVYEDHSAAVIEASTAASALGPATPGDGQHPARALRGRTSIFPTYLLADDSFIVPDMARRVVLDVTSEVEVNATWEASSQYDFNAAPAYPDPAGQFRLVRRILAGTKTAIPGTARRLNVNILLSGQSGQGGHNVFSTGSSVTLTPGVYDIWLEYLPNSVVAAVEQVIIGTRSIVVEVHKT